MKVSNKLILALKTTSFFLFLFPTIAIIFSLLINNFLVSYSSYTSLNKVDSLSFKSNNFITINNDVSILICNETNDFCGKDIHEIVPDYFDCKKNKHYQYWHYENQIFTRDEILKNVYDKKTKQTVWENIDRKNLKKIEFRKSDDIDNECIKNSSFYWAYLKYPILIDIIENIRNKKNFTLGTSEIVNPFFYGETSISNIVKRKPIAFFFKPLMFIACILMFLYWLMNNMVAKRVLNENKNFKFYTIGILSAIFLFFHVLFLGIDVDNEIFKKIRRIIIVLFILFEIIAQVLLIINLKKYLNKFEIILSKKVLLIKQILITLMVLATIIILIILSFLDLSSTFDYILEWNYFQILLFFYLLSSFLWKKES